MSDSTSVALVELHDATLESVTKDASSLVILLSEVSCYLAEDEEEFGIHRARVRLMATGPQLNVRVPASIRGEWVSALRRGGVGGAPYPAEPLVPGCVWSGGEMALVLANGEAVTWQCSKVWVEVVVLGEREESWSGPLFPAS